MSFHICTYHGPERSGHTTRRAIKLEPRSEGHSHAAPSVAALLVRNEAMAPHYSGRLAGEDFK
eukprot:1156619-Prymnesium_polylepis.1